MKLGYYACTLLLPAALLAGCTNAPASNTYTTAQAGSLQEVQYGTIVSVRNVMIKEDSAETGKLAGGVIGGVAGSDLGLGKGQIVGGVAGAVIGSTVGMVVDSTVQAKPGVELTIKLEDGKTVALAQLADEPFRLGEQVKILTDKNGKARVAH